MAELTSLNPAQRMVSATQGSHLRRLRRRPCLVDPAATWTIHAEDSESSQEYTPFEGFELTAKVTDTRVRGLRVLEGGKVVGEPRGEFLRRGGSVKGRRELHRRRAPQRPPGPRPVDDPPAAGGADPGDFGADVIKIEHPSRGDACGGTASTRTANPVVEDDQPQQENLGPLLGDPDGARIFKQLARTADVIVENFRPGTLERWGSATTSSPLTTRA